jgi:hypothetical protein
MFFTCKEIIVGFPTSLAVGESKLQRESKMQRENMHRKI